MSDLGAGAPPPPRLGDLVADDEVAAVLGAPAEQVELLAHNPLNAVTGGIWRVRRRDRTAIVKVLSDGTSAAGPGHWSASTDDRHWNSWRREVRAYASDLARHLRPDGVDAPGLLRLDERGDGTAVLWLEDVTGRTGAELEPRDVVDLAAALGRAQGRLAATGGWDEPWLSHGFLRAYSGSRPVDRSRLDRDAAWSHPRLPAGFTALRDDLRRLHDDRAELWSLAEACPRTFCHLDVWPANVIRRPGGQLVLLDWSFCGDGALGEDLANLLPDSVFDLLLPHDCIDDMAAGAEAAYLDGVAEGWDGDPRWVRLGIRAAAVKYHWLADRVLAVADRQEATVYGGRTVPIDRLIEARAAGLALVARWAAEARGLAAELDLR